MTADALHHEPMRLLFNGHVVRNAGSSPSGFHRLLEELLQRGHEITFVGKRSFVYPADLIEVFPNLRFVDATNRLTDTLWERVGRRVGPVGAPLGILNHRRYMASVLAAMRAEHARQPFDAVLYLNLPAFGRVGSIPVVSWVQGAPGSDVRSLKRHTTSLRQTEGSARLALLRMYGLYRLSRLGLPDYGASDAVVVGSQVSAAVLNRTFCIAAEKISVMPIPLDFRMFPPRSQPGPSQEPLRVLWLGRIVPRKRLDLLLGGCARAIERGIAVQLRIVGGATFAPGLRQLIAAFPYPDALNWTPRVGRDEVPSLMHWADVLAQPSEEEDFGASVAEAQACGTPVIVGPTNGTGDYICDASFRLAGYEPETLADALTECERRKRSGTLVSVEETRRTAHASYSVEPVADALERMLRGEPANWQPMNCEIACGV